MSENVIKIANERETASFAKTLADVAEPGDVIALVGDLGTGKTTLTKYIAAGLGVTEIVTSPTFNIICEYKSGRMPLYHFDVYRLADAGEADDLGFDEYFYGDGLCVVEWADLIPNALPQGSRFIFIEPGDDENSRTIRGDFKFTDQVT